MEPETKSISPTKAEIVSILAKRGRPLKYWAFDSEFLMSGRAGHPEDVHTIQFSDGKESWVLNAQDDLKKWLRAHNYIHTLYGFVVLPDLGSMREWLGENHVIYKKKGVQHTGWINYAGAKIHVVDAQPILTSFGLRRLSSCGDMIGYPKLPKPEWLGLRNWETQDEYKSFIEYAKADAIITSRIVQWLIEKYGADPAKYVSSGTIAGHEFNFPRRLKKVKNRVLMTPHERLIKLNTFAGRSEVFWSGFTPKVLYNDVASLYPISIVATRALQIKSAKLCDFKELVINDDLSETSYGWIAGVFSSDNDMWGLPVRGKRNYYMTGTIPGLFNTFDIAASKAKIINVTRCFKPVFREDPTEHDKYGDMLMRKLEGKLGVEEKGYIKAILNAVSGKLGQSHPIGERSNFLAYNILLGHSHLVMSKLFDKCTARIIGMDTDSIFAQQDMTGKWFEVSDGERVYPIKMDVKGKGDLAFFRSKRYIMQGEKPYYAAHGWRYFVEDYLKLFNGDLTDLDTRISVKSTLFTLQKAAQAMTKGRWFTRPEHLTLDKIKELLAADDKRSRETYDSYGLVMEHKNVGSTAWDYDDYMATTADDFLGIIPER